MTDDAATHADANREVLDRQREQWCGSYEPGVARFGAAASEPAQAAASALFASEGKRELLELGAGSHSVATTSWLSWAGRAVRQ